MLRVALQYENIQPWVEEHFLTRALKQKRCEQLAKYIFTSAAWIFVFARLEVEIRTCLRSRTRLFDIMLKRDEWGLEFACEIWVESRLAEEMRIMAEQQQSKALLSSALILPRPASRSATISSIPQRGRLACVCARVCIRCWGGGRGCYWRCCGKSCSHFPATHPANHSSVWRQASFKDLRVRRYNFPPARRSRGAQQKAAGVASGVYSWCWGAGCWRAGGCRSQTVDNHSSIADEMPKVPIC